jgi:hypothetical protein
MPNEVRLTVPAASPVCTGRAANSIAKAAITDKILGKLLFMLFSLLFIDTDKTILMTNSRAGLCLVSLAIRLLEPYSIFMV